MLILDYFNVHSGADYNSNPDGGEHETQLCYSYNILGVVEKK